MESTTFLAVMRQVNAKLVTWLVSNWKEYHRLTSTLKEHVLIFVTNEYSCASTTTVEVKAAYVDQQLAQLMRLMKLILVYMSIPTSM